MTLLNWQHNYPLQAHNTFGFAATAAHAVHVQHAESLPAIFAEAQAQQWLVTVLGGGSNVILQSDLPGATLLMSITGRRLVTETADAWIVECGAGEVWHDFVAWTIAQGWGGLENLALIPGTVGASPVQNIGAYGVEMADRFHSLTAYDRSTQAFVTLTAADCAFAYRDSLFKQAGQDRYIITAVRFAFPKVWQAHTAYADVANELAALGITTPTAQQIFDAVVAIRTRKLPDPKVIGNAGSFFKNPLVSAAQRDALLTRFPSLVSYLQSDGTYKLAAGWLIDQCGWKGKRFAPLNHVGVYDKQALVLVHYGDGTGAELMQLAAAIQADVFAKFGVHIEPEPVRLPASTNL